MAAAASPPPTEYPRGAPAAGPRPALGISSSRRRRDSSSQVPRAGDFQALSDTVKKIPMVGSALANNVDRYKEDIASNLADAGRAAAAAPETTAALGAVVLTLEASDDTLELFKRPGGALTEHLLKTASAPLAAGLAPVVHATLETHAITKVWDGAISAYNAAATKCGVAPLEFDLAACGPAPSVASAYLRVVAAAAPRSVSAEYPRRARGVAATRLRGLPARPGGRAERAHRLRISTSHPRRCRDPSPRHTSLAGTSSTRPSRRSVCSSGPRRPGSARRPATTRPRR